MSVSTSTPSPTERLQRRAEIRAVIAMAVPGVLTHSSRALMDVADYLLVTFLRSPDAQAAILPAQLMMWTYMVLPMGIVTIVNTFAAQSLGRKEYRECSAYAWQSLGVAVAAGVIGLALFPFLPALIASFGHDPAVQAQELVYARVILYAVVPTVASNGLAMFFIGVHRPWVAMWSVLESNVVNVLASIILMFGYCGFEPMGIAGAAWGTFVAVWYRTIRLAAAMVTPAMHAQYACRSSWRPSWTRMLALIRVGSPHGIMWVGDCLVWTIFVGVLVGKMFGAADLIATNSAWQYMRVAFLPAMGVGQALTALVGRSIGAGDPQRAMRETRFTILLTVLYMGTLSLVYTCWGRTLISWFSADSAVLDIGARVMICAAVFQLFDAFGITYMSALRGAGDTIIPAMALFVANWVVLIGGGWATARLFPQWGSIGPWMAGAALIFLAAAFLHWRWHCGAWRKIDIFKGAKPESEEFPPAALSNVRQEQRQ